ncbi:heterokaryon incompatibility protein [Rutstroemia sp. NJR-2017a BBW]|nr:heterokaryon incompatibility protein [Rutstroemia sp. NJR-2017a BBW]
MTEYASLTVKAGPKVPLVPLTEEQNDAWQLSLAKAWLYRCVTTHSKCQSEKSTWVPTRVLELGSSSDKFVRLIDTREKVVNKPYVTLSHCWGLVEFFKLTTKTLSLMLTGIETDTLSSTFQDAIRTAQFLGVEYLWIDALCILQDSKEDWELESALMGKVYRNGLCNLAATGSKNGEGGLFTNHRKRYPPMTNPFSIISSWYNETNDCWDVRLSHLRKGHLLSGPLLDRGWVVQERIMSRRNIHFGSQQLYWECPQHDACEIYTEGLPGDFYPLWGELLNFKHQIEPIDVNLDVIPGNSFQHWQANKMLNLWARTVCTFSECQLTRSEDKLPALSGIAKAIQPFLANGDYFAGLWGEDIIPNLLWFVEIPDSGFTGPPRRPQAYRAPSWSWASIEVGRVVMGSRSNADYGDERNPMPEVQILDIRVEALTSDPTGQVKSGSLQLFGPLMTVTVTTEPGYGNRWVIINNKRELNLEIRPDVASDWYGDIELHIIPVQAHWYNKRYNCLLLQPTGLKEGQFRRWGWMFLERGHYNIADWASVENDGWFEFEENDGHGRSRFTII